MIIFGIGIVASRVTRNLSDYMLGGRRLGGAIAAMGVGASDMSGWLLLGLPGAFYAHGINQIFMPIGLVLGAYLNWQFVAARLRVYTEQVKDALTIPAYLDNRFHDGSGTLRIVTALVVMSFFTIYAAAGFVGGAILFQSTFGLSYHTALFIGAVALVSYTCIGGFLAVSWVDFFQGTLMFIALIVVPSVAIWHVGSWQQTMTILAGISSKYTDALTDFDWVTVIGLLAWGLGYFGQPHILVRFMATKSKAEIPKARFICMLWMIVALYGAMFTGLVGVAYFRNSPLANPEEDFLQFAHVLFNPWVTGILLAAVLSAIMSTIAAQLLASASAVTEDFYRRFLRPHKASARELLMVSRIAVFIIACVAFAFAYNPKNNVLKLVSYGWGGLGASFGPVILFSLYWPRINKAGAVAGIVLGAVTAITWWALHGLGGIFHLYLLVPGFIVSCLSIVVVSLLTMPPSAAIRREFNEVNDILQH